MERSEIRVLAHELAHISELVGVCDSAHDVILGARSSADVIAESRYSPDQARIIYGCLAAAAQQIDKAKHLATDAQAKKQSELINKVAVAFERVT